MSILVADLRMGLAEPKLAEASVDFRRVWVKDKLISYFLSFIYNHNTYRKLVFYGGTCARVVYGLNRLSEDIDLHNPGIDVSKLGADLTTYVTQKMGIKGADVYVQGGESGINRFVVRMPIMQELGLAPHSDAKLYVKIEVSGGNQTYNMEKTQMLRDGQAMVIAHFDKPSLMAGKMIACMERIWRKGKMTGASVKGRDFYDLVWYLQNKVEPNAEKLAHDGNESYTVDRAWQLLDAKVVKLRKEELGVDLRGFIEEPVYLSEWLDNFQDFYKRGRAGL